MIRSKSGISTESATDAEPLRNPFSESEANVEPEQSCRRQTQVDPDNCFAHAHAFGSGRSGALSGCKFLGAQPHDALCGAGMRTREVRGGNRRSD
jgi:hypothetical protein